MHLIMRGHLTLTEACGGDPTLEDCALLSAAIAAWDDAERRADAPKGGA